MKLINYQKKKRSLHKMNRFVCRLKIECIVFILSFISIEVLFLSENEALDVHFFNPIITYLY